METAAATAAVLAGLSILVVSFGMSRLVARAELDARLNTFVRRHAVTVTAPVSVKRQQEESTSAFFARINRRLQQASYGRRIRARLVRAGLKVTAAHFIMVQGAAAGAGLLAAYVVVEQYVSQGDLELLGACATGAVVGWFIPTFYLRFKEGRRLARFEKQLPTTIDAMAGALQAGSSLPQSMEMVGREMPDPIGEEFAGLVRELSVGVTMTEAFAGMLDRVRSLDLDMLLTAINIQHRIGGNLSQILRSIAHTVRERQRIRGDIAVLTAQQRLSAYLVSFLPIGIIGVLFLIAPTYIGKLFDPGITRVLLVLGGTGIVAGFYCMRKIADIDV